MSDAVAEFLGRLYSADHRAAVWAVCQCVRQVVPVGKPDARVLRAFETAEAWALGEATEAECRTAYLEIEQPARLTYTMMAAQNVVPACLEEGPALERLTDAILNVAFEIAISEYSDRSEVWRGKGHQRALNDLHALMLGIRWPLTTPTPEQLRAERPEAQILWDDVCEVTEPLPMGFLVGAKGRAGRLYLDWSKPAQRAIAERATDEERARKLLEIDKLQALIEARLRKKEAACG